MYKAIGLYASAVVIFVLLSWTRAFPGEMLNIDEVIPIAISASMGSAGALDPNWANADLPPYFKYDQYNFYLYNVVAHFAIQIGADWGLAPLKSLRTLNWVLQFFSILLIAAALRRSRIGVLGIVCGALSACLLPQWAQDAAMARPESLIYFLMALLIWMCVSIQHRVFGPAAIGFVLALGIATKFNFLVFAAPVVLFWVLRNGLQSAADTARMIGAATLGGIAGIVLSMPYALINFDVYVSGIRYLLTHYDGHHPPHSKPDWNVFTQFYWLVSYFAVTMGAFLGVTLAGSVGLREVRKAGALWFIAPFLIMLLYFSTKPVFFERNFSQSLPPLSIAFGMVVHGLKGWLEKREGTTALAITAAVLIAACFSQMTYWTVQINDVAQNRGERRAAFEERNSLTEYTDFDLAQAPQRKIPDCGRFSILEYNDPWTRANIASLKAGGYVNIAVYRSKFTFVPTSTLHTYLDANVHYLEKPC